MKHRHCWFTEQQTGHRWCHLCGKHPTGREAEDDAFARTMSLVRRRPVNAIAGPPTLTPRGVS